MCFLWENYEHFPNTENKAAHKIIYQISNKLTGSVQACQTMKKIRSKYFAVLFL
jgi:hypothetical protein